MSSVTLRRVPAVTRVALGLLAMLGVVDAVLHGLGAAAMGPAARIPFPGLAWVPVPSARGWYVLMGLGVGAALAVAMDVAPRIAAGIAALVLGCSVAADQALYSNNAYLLTLGLLCLALDAPDLMRLLVTTVYACTALAKLNPDYLSGAVMAHVIGQHSLLPLPALLLTPTMIRLESWGVLGSEIFLAWALWCRPTRKAAVGLGLALHTAALLVMPTGLVWAMAFVEIGGGVVALYPAFFVAGHRHEFGKAAAGAVKAPA